MADSIEYFIDNKPFTTHEATRTVEEILSIVDLSAEQFYLISPDGTQYVDPKQNIEIRSGDRFITKKRDHDTKPPSPLVIYYSVNGEQQSTTSATLSVEDILRSAGKAASIDLQQLNSYILENIKTSKKYELLTAVVEILNDDQFLAVHSGATPVALLLMP